MRPSRPTTRTAVLIVCVIIASIVVGTEAFLVIGMPAIQAHRESQQRQKCVDNMRQLGNALREYHDRMNKFPKPASEEKAEAGIGEQKQ